MNFYSSYKICHSATIRKITHIVELDGNIFITAQHNENVI